MAEQPVNTETCEHEWGDPGRAKAGARCVRCHMVTFLSPESAAEMLPQGRGMVLPNTSLGAKARASLQALNEYGSGLDMDAPEREHLARVLDGVDAVRSFFGALDSVRRNQELGASSDAERERLRQFEYAARQAVGLLP